MSARAEPLELLRHLAEVMREEGARWYLFGAQAVAAYGVPRMTGDVDVTAEVSPGRLEHFVSAMRRADFVLRVDDPAEFVRRARVLPFGHGPTNLPLDVVLAGPGLEALFLARARTISLGDVEIPVIAPEDLIVTKLLAARAKDLDDVKGVLRQQSGKLDQEMIRDTL